MGVLISILILWSLGVLVCLYVLVFHPCLFTKLYSASVVGTRNGMIKMGKNMGENTSDKIKCIGLHICKAVEKV